MVYLYRRLHYHCECQQLYNHYSTQRKEIVRMERPEFSEIKDYDEFCKYYWYREELTLGTGLIECGFTFGNRFREFFAEQTGVRPFKFNVDMVASAKAVKENGDESFTLGDLLDIYYGKRTYVKYDKSVLQWNKFVKDFCADDATKIFDERLKAAASLWSIVRDSDMKKEYSHELFEKYKDSITI